MKLAELQESVTNEMIAQMESGTVAWQSDVIKDLPRNAESQRYFKGINVIILMMAQLRGKYRSNQWLTFNQIKRMGGRISGEGEARKASAYVIEPRTFKEKNVPEGKEPRVGKYFVGSARWNLDQVDGIELEITEPVSHSDDDANDMRASAQRITDAGVTLHRGGSQPCFHPSENAIYLPVDSAFKTAQGMFSTSWHELIHATGHASRLGRDFGPHGSTKYAFEELIAELGAAMACARAGVKARTEMHASYLEGWLSVLKGDKSALFRAAEKATKAIEWIDNALGVETN